MSRRSKLEAPEATRGRYWSSHTTIGLSRPLVDALKALAKPGERYEDTIRRLVEQAVAAQEKESA